MADINPPKPAATPTTGATPAAAAAAAATEPVTRAISRRDDKVGYEHPTTRRAAWRDKLNEGFRTFLWVAPLTALIWIYAERAQIAPLEVRVPVKVVSTSPDRVVTMVAPTDGYVTLDLRAPRAGLDAVRERLSTNARPIEVTIPDDIAPGFEGDISVTDRIERNPIFTEWAVDVERSFPSVRIRVEKKASRVLRIERKPEDSSFANVTFDPPTVRIEGPQSYIDKIKPDQAAYTDLEKLRGYAPGTHEAQVSVLDFDHVNVTKEPKRVTATVEIRSGDKETLGAVGIWTLLPATSLKALPAIAPTSPTLPNVEVSGPPAQIARLRPPNPEFVAKVRVAIDQNDLLQTRFTKRVSAEDYVLPPGVTVVNPGREITFTVEPR